MGCSGSKGVRPALPAVGRCTLTCRCGHQCGGAEGEAAEKMPKRLASPVWFCRGPCDTTADAVAGADTHACGDCCLGCVESGCPENRYDGYHCPICLEAIDCNTPSVRLQCSHAVHYKCIRDMLNAIDWRGHEVNAASLNCPSGCGRQMHHPLLTKCVEPMARVVSEARKVAQQQAVSDGNGATPEQYRVYQCFQCMSCFCGGLRQCEGEGEGDGLSVLCEVCQRRSGNSCKLHGDEFCLKKCNYCCQVATFSCAGGKAMFCTACHIGAAEAYHRGKWQEWHDKTLRSLPVCIPSQCPFSGAHPRGHTSAWRSPCLQCYRGVAVQDSGSQAPRQRIKCESPGCQKLGHAEPAAWNGWGRFCCNGCMTWAANATMRPNCGCSPSSCHEARCSENPCGQQRS